MLAEEGIDIVTATYQMDTRAKLKHEEVPSRWSSLFLLPVPGYSETSSYGPVSRRGIEWIELDPIELRFIGPRVPRQILDHTEQILQQLEAHNIRAQVLDGWIRILL